MQFHPDTTSLWPYQVAEWYCVDRHTLYRWLREAGLYFKRGKLRPCDLKIIFETFGYPEEIARRNREASRASTALKADT
ncbi:MAG: hypothetical protein IPI97_15480 [Nitrosomonas sp.]|nr:hypothetical protein [Nitrosomonas sp.]